MSNLKLPTMTFNSLLRVMFGNSHQTSLNTQKTIAYATTAHYVAKDGSTDAYVVICHHGTVIAEIARGWVYVTNAGYDSATTRDRIHKILTDNQQVYGGLWLSQIAGKQVLHFAGKQDKVLTREFHSAHWDFENRTVDMHGNRGVSRDGQATL